MISEDAETYIILVGLATMHWNKYKSTTDHEL